MPEGQPAPVAPPEPAEPPAERTVPYDRFKQVNDQLSEAKKQLGTFEARMEELEAKDKTELEQERAKRERAEAKAAELQGEADALSGKLTATERSSWVRDAATAAKFIDPADALGRVNLSEIESEAEAKKAVKAIAESAKHLVAAEQPTPPTVPGRVVANGQPADPNAPDPAAEENEAFLAELKEASSKGWSTSSAGILDA